MVKNKGKAVARTLGILVTSEDHLDYVVALTHAAHENGVKVEIFFTGKAVRLTLSPDFDRLSKKARVSVCESSFRCFCREGGPSRAWSNELETQSRNAEMLTTCDRYVVF